MRVRVWDLPTRLFHWLLALAVAAAVVTGQIGGNLMAWHGRCGIFVVGLLGFRVVWGLAGSTYARFARFAPTPARLRAYLAGRWHGLGHNPLGALSLFAMLAVLAIQATTGLFAADDIAFNGPLRTLVSDRTSDRLGGIHELLANLVYLLVALHVSAIVFYARVRKINLVMPMLTGWHDTEDAQAQPARGGGFIALIAALSIGAGAAYAASGAWISAPPPPAAKDLPTW